MVVKEPVFLLISSFNGTHYNKHDLFHWPISYCQKLCHLLSCNDQRSKDVAFQKRRSKDVEVLVDSLSGFVSGSEQL